MISLAKERIKERIRISNENVKNGFPPDEWVLEYRRKNNEIKRKWKLKQPLKEKKKKVANKTSFFKGQIPHNKNTEEQRQESLKRWRENTKLWHKKNRDRINELKRYKRENDIDFKLKCNLRKRLSFLLRNSFSNKSEQTMVYLGCSIDFFKNYLSNNFIDGMSFENYGEWHLDHIVPCYYFDLNIEEDRKKCFHYTNFQPLWAVDNLKKNKRLQYD
jgi:hypothetical protein